jgi:DNA-binding NarL/FixJ family response regulator
MEPEIVKRRSSDFSSEEARVLKLLRQGQTLDAIARELGIDWSAVAARVSPIIKKAGARNRVELLALIDKLAIK